MSDPPSAGLGRTVPALPVRDVPAAVAFYVDRLAFGVAHQDDGFAVLSRDDAVINLWEAGDEGWRTRTDLTERPVCSGAESFLAGTASCRVETADVDAVWAGLDATGALHPVSRETVIATDFGTREVNALDLDGNLLTFFHWTSPA